MPYFKDFTNAFCDPLETDKQTIYPLNTRESSEDRALFTKLFTASSPEDEADVRNFISYFFSLQDEDEISEIYEIFQSYEKQDWDDYINMCDNDDFYNRITFIAVNKYRDEQTGVYTLFKDLQQSPRLSYYVPPTQRGKGYAADGYNAITQASVRLGVSINFAEVRTDNKESIRFLLKQGFKTVARVECNTMAGEIWGADVFWMQRKPSVSVDQVIDTPEL